MAGIGLTENLHDVALDFTGLAPLFLLPFAKIKSSRNDGLKRWFATGRKRT
jgi:hypothetical protein